MTSQLLNAKGGVTHRSACPISRDIITRGANRSRHWRREGEEVYRNHEIRLLAPDEIGSKAALVPRQGLVDFDEEPFLVLRQSAAQIQIVGVVITG